MRHGLTSAHQTAVAFRGFCERSLEIGYPMSDTVPSMRASLARLSLLFGAPWKLAARDTAQGAQRVGSPRTENLPGAAGAADAA